MQKTHSQGPKFPLATHQTKEPTRIRCGSQCIAGRSALERMSPRYGEGTPDMRLVFYNSGLDICGEYTFACATDVTATSARVCRCQLLLIKVAMLKRYKTYNFKPCTVARWFFRCLPRSIMVSHSTYGQFVGPGDVVADECALFTCVLRVPIEWNK